MDAVAASSKRLQLFPSLCGRNTLGWLVMAQHSLNGNPASEAAHVTVYRKEGRWAAVPANHGIWSWGDEIVVGFVVGQFKRDGGFHARDRDRPYVAMQARSRDGGLHWEVSETPCRVPGDCRSFSADEHMRADLGVGHALGPGKINQPAECPGSADFRHPDFALMCAKTGLGAGTVSWFYTSTDRCHSWDGPFRLPDFGLSGVEARTDYLVSGPSECLLFLTGAMESGGEGGTVFVARTVDGGRTFENLASIAGAEKGSYVIMPASTRLDEDRILVAVRCRGGSANVDMDPCWIDLYATDDNGSTWRYLCRPVAETGQGGNPPTLTKLIDGRFCITYGFRNAPYGMRARLSGDNGETWGDEIVLRSDAGSHDIGYPRTIQRPDGTVVTIYWTNDDPEGERYIAATLWRP
jgi:hypothetical protein